MAFSFQHALSILTFACFAIKRSFLSFSIIFSPTALILWSCLATLFLKAPFEALNTLICYSNQKLSLCIRNMMNLSFSMVEKALNIFVSSLHFSCYETSLILSLPIISKLNTLIPLHECSLSAGKALNTSCFYFIEILSPEPFYHQFFEPSDLKNKNL